MQEESVALNPAARPPIPFPGALPAAPVQISGDWQSQPKVLRKEAYQWALLVMWGSAIIGGLCVLGAAETNAERINFALFFGFWFLISLWQRKALRRGGKGAWQLQVVLSVLGLLWFPIGTIIHGYILSQWSKPEVKAWFGQGDI